MIKIKKSRDHQFYVTYVATNGEVLCTSEMFTQKHNALKNIASLSRIFEADDYEVIDETIKPKP